MPTLHKLEIAFGKKFNTNGGAAFGIMPGYKEIELASIQIEIEENHKHNQMKSKLEKWKELKEEM